MKKKKCMYKKVQNNTLLRDKVCMDVVMYCNIYIKQLTNKQIA